MRSIEQCPGQAMVLVVEEDPSGQIWILESPARAKESRDTVAWQSEPPSTTLALPGEATKLRDSPRPGCGDVSSPLETQDSSHQLLGIRVAAGGSAVSSSASCYNFHGEPDPVRLLARQGYMGLEASPWKARKMEWKGCEGSQWTARCTWCSVQSRQLGTNLSGAPELCCRVVAGIDSQDTGADGAASLHRLGSSSWP